MTIIHTFATHRKSGVINTDDNALDFNLSDDRVEQNSGFVPGSVNLNYAPTALHAFAAVQEPSPQADYPSISSNLVATESIVSFSTADGFSNKHGDLVTHKVFSPPDNGVAIGDNGYIVSVVNDTIGWTPDLSTKMQFAAFSRFFPSSLVGGMSFTDPQVLYHASDASHGRFIVTEELSKSNSTQSKILIAVSHDANPTGIPKDKDWDFFSIDSQYSFNGTRTAADYPQSDTDGVNLFITSDQFSSSGNYFGSVVTVIPLSSIENGEAEISFSRFSAYDGSSTGTPIKETLDVAGNPEKGAFFVGYDGYSYDGYSKKGNELVTIGYYNDSTAEMTVKVLDVGDIDDLRVETLVATEPDRHSLEAGDRRITDVKVIGNDLFAVTETVPSPDSQPNVHWFDFDVSNPTEPRLRSQGDLRGSDLPGRPIGVTTFNGSITGDSNYLVLNFTATGPSLKPSDYFAVSTNAGHSWETPVRYATSPTSYSDSDGSTISRWGDYSSAVVDPTQDHAFLISNEYAVDAHHWGTKIADVSLDSSGNAVNPAPADMLLASMVATTPNASGSVDGSTALLTQYMAAGFQGGFDNGGGYTASPTPEAIFGEAPLLTKPTT